MRNPMLNRHGDPSGFVAFLVAFILLFGAVVGVLANINHTFHVDCLRLHEQTGLGTKYARSGMSGECYVQLEDGRWVPQDRWVNLRDDK